MLAPASYTAQDVSDYYILGMGVRGITFRFYDSDPGTADWRSSWNVPAVAGGAWDRPRLPYAVHVTVDIESRTGQYAESFAELIYLGQR